MKRLTLFKPDIRSGVMKNEEGDKYKYLCIPDNLGIKTLKNDISLGAVQFQEIVKIIEKKNSPQYIVVTTNNLELGYMAVTYMQACFNEEEGCTFNENDCNDEKNGIDVWKENDFQIPIINENDLITYDNFDQNLFSMENMFAQGNCNTKKCKPYWLTCTNRSVCIVANEFGLNYGDDEYGHLNIFDYNQHVFILLEENSFPFSINVDEQVPVENGTDEWYDDGSMEKIKGMLLKFSADDVYVKLEKEEEYKFYVQLLKGGFDKYNIKTKRGFNYKKIVDMICAMKEKNKCELTDRIIKYAIKDKNEEEKRIVTNNDFMFMNRFLKTRFTKANSNEPSAQTMNDELVGMEYVKEQVLDIVNVMQYNKMRWDMNIGGGVYHNVHAMVGAPGTAKTTMAKLMGQIMVERGLLRDNRFICINGAELKGKYVGHSAPKTKAIFNNYDIIVIDEAYSIVESNGEYDSFSNEAIAQLIIELEEHSMDKLVVFTGYGGKKISEKNNKMRNFFDANPGIRSRITSVIYFDSYTPEEMVEIFYNMAKTKSYILDDTAREYVYNYFEKRVKDENFGNGREARKLLETVILFVAKRLFQKEKKYYTNVQMRTIICEDIVNAIERMERAEMEAKAEQRKLGFCM